MHTDEYEISLGRELAVCEGYIRTARAELDRMEARHGMTTNAFLRGAAADVVASNDRDAWRRAHESLLRWSAARDEYCGFLDLMRQSAPP